MEPGSEVPSLVLDNGSYLLKAGVSGEDGARTVIPNHISLSTLTQVSLVGYEVSAEQGPFELRHPLERGEVVDWEAMEKVWTHVFYLELRMSPEEHPCLITDAPLACATSREQLLQVFFETFNVPAFYVALPPVLALYSYGRTTGLVLDSGDSLTSAVPITDGNTHTAAIQRTELAGKDLTEHLCSMMQERGRFAGLSAADFVVKALSRRSTEWEVVRAIKERFCYIADGSELESVKKGRFVLPDGHAVEIEDERVLCPEVMFQPQREATPLPEVVASAIRSCPEALQNDLYMNVVLCGGNTMISWLPERLNRELRKKMPSEAKVKVLANSERRSSAWIGGSILTSLSTFPAMSEDTCGSRAETTRSSGQ